MTNFLNAEQFSSSNGDFIIDERRQARRQNLKRLLKPRHVAFIGGKAMEEAIDMLRAADYQGEIWVVNPRYEALAGLPVFKTVADLPEAPDASFLYVSKAITNDIVAELATIGAGGAICFAAGYAELGETGRSQQDELDQIAGNLALMGPNSNGLLNYFDGIPLWPIRDHEPEQFERAAAIISSSGGLLFNINVNTRSVQAGYMLSVGNQGFLDHSDYLDVVLDDPRVSVVGLYLEDPGDVIALSHAAAKALKKGIPIVAIKTGRNEVSAMLAQTHSGALAVDDDWIEALFSRCGIVRVSSLSAFMETLKLLTTTAIPKGRRMAVLTNGGGDKAMMGDAVEGYSMELPQPSPEVAAKLRTIIPDFATISNPFDYNAYYAGAGEDVFAEDNPAQLEHCYRTMLEDDYDILVMMHGSRVDLQGNYEPPAETEQAWIATTKGSDKCVVQLAKLPEHMPLAYRELLIANDIAPLQGLESAMVALDRAIRWQEAYREKGGLDLAEIALLPLPDLPQKGHLSSEAKGKAILTSLGVPVPDHWIVAPTEARAAADDIGYPVVVKVVEPVIAHKAKSGALALNLMSADAVEEAIERMINRLTGQDIKIEKVLVEGMITDVQKELFLGICYDPRFGHALGFGRGGVDVEELRDVELALLPLSDNKIQSFVKNQRVTKNLSDTVVDKVIDIVTTIANYTVAERGQLISLDINPLIVTRNGDVIAVDALVETKV